MRMGDLLNTIVNNGSGIALVLLLLNVFIEVTPIKINPISTALAWCGKHLNKDQKKEMKDISKKLDDLTSRVEDVEVRLDKNKVDDIRTTIFNFADKLRINPNQSKEEFEHIMDLHDQYVVTIAERGLVNGKMDVTYSFIKAVYENNFNRVETD